MSYRSDLFDIPLPALETRLDQAREQGNETEIDACLEALCIRTGVISPDPDTWEGTP